MFLETFVAKLYNTKQDRISLIMQISIITPVTVFTYSCAALSAAVPQASFECNIVFKSCSSGSAWFPILPCHSLLVPGLAISISDTSSRFDIIAT